MIHFLKNIDLDKPIPRGYKEIILGAGCFWGVERKFWDLNGIYLTSVGYCGGELNNPSYEDVCRGESNHAEVVKIYYDPNIITLSALLIVFWECHDPTQGMRQGNDIGTQYRSIINCSHFEDLKILHESKNKYQLALLKKGFSEITTEIVENQRYYLAEEYHQQYLAKNPNGYCGFGGTNCPFPK